MTQESYPHGEVRIQLEMYQGEGKEYFNGIADEALKKEFRKIYNDSIPLQNYLKKCVKYKSNGQHPLQDLLDMDLIGAMILLCNNNLVGLPFAEQFKNEWNINISPTFSGTFSEFLKKSIAPTIQFHPSDIPSTTTSLTSLGRSSVESSGSETKSEDSKPSTRDSSPDPTAKRSSTSSDSSVGSSPEEKTLTTFQFASDSIVPAKLNDALTKAAATAEPSEVKEASMLSIAGAGAHLNPITQATVKHIDVPVLTHSRKKAEQKGGLTEDKERGNSTNSNSTASLDKAVSSLSPSASIMRIESNLSQTTREEKLPRTYTGIKIRPADVDQWQKRVSATNGSENLSSPCAIDKIVKKAEELKSLLEQYVILTHPEELKNSTENRINVEKINAARKRAAIPLLLAQEQHPFTKAVNKKIKDFLSLDKNQPPFDPDQLLTPDLSDNGKLDYAKILRFFFYGPVRFYTFFKNIKQDSNFTRLVLSLAILGGIAASLTLGFLGEIVQRTLSDLGWGLAGPLVVVLSLFISGAATYLTKQISRGLNYISNLNYPHAISKTNFGNKWEPTLEVKRKHGNSVLIPMLKALREQKKKSINAAEKKWWNALLEEIKKNPNINRVAGISIQLQEGGNTYVFRYRNEKWQIRDLREDARVELVDIPDGDIEKYLPNNHTRSTGTEAGALYDWMLEKNKGVMAELPGLINCSQPKQIFTRSTRASEKNRSCTARIIAVLLLAKANKPGDKIAKLARELNMKPGGPKLNFDAYSLDNPQALFPTIPASSSTADIPASVGPQSYGYRFWTLFPGGSRVAKTHPIWGVLLLTLGLPITGPLIILYVLIIISPFKLYRFLFPSDVTAIDSDWYRFWNALPGGKVIGKAHPVLGIFLLTLLAPITWPLIGIYFSLARPFKLLKKTVTQHKGRYLFRLMGSLLIGGIGFLMLYPPFQVGFADFAKQMVSAIISFFSLLFKVTPIDISSFNAALIIGIPLLIIALNVGDLFTNKLRKFVNFLWNRNNQDIVNKKSPAKWKEVQQKLTQILTDRKVVDASTHSTNMFVELRHQKKTGSEVFRKGARQVLKEIETSNKLNILENNLAGSRDFTVTIDVTVDKKPQKFTYSKRSGFWDMKEEPNSSHPQDAKPSSAASTDSTPTSTSK